MKDLITTLREIKAGLADPGRREIAMLIQDLLAKQIRQSWETRSSENREPWPATVLPSFAGVLKRNKWALLHHKEKRAKDEEVFYFRGKGQLTQHSQETHTPTDAFIAQTALNLVRRAEVTDKGFETGALPKYGMWQTGGTDKTGWGGPIPERSFWGFGDDLLDLAAGIMADKAAKAFAGAA